MVLAIWVPKVQLGSNAATARRVMKGLRFKLVGWEYLERRFKLRIRWKVTWKLKLSDVLSCRGDVFFMLCLITLHFARGVHV